MVKIGVKLEDIHVHDVEEPNGYLHQMLVGMKLPDFPVAMGVIRSVKAPVYDQLMETQIEEVKKKSQKSKPWMTCLIAAIHGL